MKKLLITGISGLLGGGIAHALRDKYAITGWYNAHGVSIPGVKALKIDITEEQPLKKALAEDRPDMILHCASLTNVDYCEKDRVETQKINVGGTENIVAACKQGGIKLVYISTDSVYDGKTGNYAESDPVSPCNYYGVTKYEAEDSVRKYKNHLIVRTNIFGWNIQNKQSLAEWILDNLEAGKCINGFKDAVFSSIYTIEFAKIMEQMLERNLTGTFNLGSRTSLSKYEFALLIAKVFNKDVSLIKPISIDDFSFAAKRGKNLSMNTQKLSKALDRELPSLEECVQEFFRDYKNGMPDKIKKWSAE